MPIPSRTAALAGLLIVLIIAFLARHASAATPQSATYNVQRNGTPLFCASGIAVSGNTYNFTGDCSMPVTRQLTATLTYVPPGGTLVTGVTECDQIMGRASASDPIVPFPGRPNAAPVINNFGRTNFISCHFRAPVSGATFGWWKPTEYNHGFDLTSAISTTMGDFNPSGAGCRMVSGSGQNLVGWNTDGTKRSLCQLVAGRDYYLSMKATNPQQVTAVCPLRNQFCVVGLANSFGG